MYGSTPFKAPDHDEGRDDDVAVLSSSDRKLVFEKISNWKDGDVMDKVCEGSISHRSQTMIDSDCIDFCAQLMIVDPESRMSAVQALEHPFLQKNPLDDTAKKQSPSPSVAQRCQLFEQAAKASSVATF